MATFTGVQKAIILRTAKNVDPYFNKIKKLKEQIKQLEEEIIEAQQMIDLTEAPVQQMTGGYTTSDLVKKETVETGAVTPQGYQIRKNVWEFIYPETILPAEGNDSKENQDNTNEAQSNIGSDEDIDTHKFTANYI